LAFVVVRAITDDAGNEPVLKFDAESWAASQAA
jgi:hypothetical protein